MTTGEAWITSPIFPWLVIVLAAWLVLFSVYNIVLNNRLKVLKDKITTLTDK